MNIHSLCAPWVALHESLGVGAPIRDDAHYKQILEVVDVLMDDITRDESSPFSGLLDVLADRIHEYEDRVHPWPDTSTPASALHFLMEQHGLSQGQLPEIGSQGVVSEILHGKRELNVRQITALSERFAVDPVVFLPIGFKRDRHSTNSDPKNLG